jgi:hypothetical protein
MALVEIGGLLQTTENRASTLDYHSILRCLVEIFRTLSAHMDNREFPEAATDYAALIETISRDHPELDVREAVGQLLEFMSWQFMREDMGWRTIHRHLLHINRVSHPARALSRVFAADIHQWLYAGVRDLFSYRARLSAVIDEAGARAADIETSIRKERSALEMLRRRLPARRDPKISIFAEKKRERTISDLLRQQRDLLLELDRKKRTMGLLTSDMRDFQTRLREARRAFVVHSV